MRIGKTEGIARPQYSPDVSKLRDMLGVNASAKEKAAFVKLGQTFAHASFRSAAMTESALNDDLFDDKYSDAERERLSADRAATVELRAATYDVESGSFTILMNYTDEGTDETFQGKAGLEAETFSPVAGLDVEDADIALEEKYGEVLALKASILSEAGQFLVPGGTHQMTDAMMNRAVWQVQITDVVDAGANQAVALVTYKNHKAEVTLEKQSDGSWNVESVSPAFKPFPGPLR